MSIFLKPKVLLGQIRCHFCENDEKLSSDKGEGKFFDGICQQFLLILKLVRILSLKTMHSISFLLGRCDLKNSTEKMILKNCTDWSS